MKRGWREGGDEQVPKGGGQAVENLGRSFVCQSGRSRSWGIAKVVSGGCLDFRTRQRERKKETGSAKTEDQTEPDNRPNGRLPSTDRRSEQCCGLEKLVRKPGGKMLRNWSTCRFRRPEVGDPG